LLTNFLLSPLIHVYLFIMICFTATLVAQTIDRRMIG
jgi:hypothetical protein